MGVSLHSKETLIFPDHPQPHALVEFPGRIVFENGKPQRRAMFNCHHRPDLSYRPGSGALSTKRLVDL
jgi:hypothetical protein